ncbi:MAG: hypothetical protein WBB76_07610 [Gaiellaceae bacterium]
MTKRIARTINRLLTDETQLVPLTLPVGRAHALACAWNREGR